MQWSDDTLSIASAAPPAVNPAGPAAESCFADAADTAAADHAADDTLAAVSLCATDELVCATATAVP